MSSRRKLLNEFLLASGKEEIALLRKPWCQLNGRSKQNHVSLTGNAVAAVLEVTVPEDVPALWEAIKSSNSVELAIGKDASTPADELYLQALAETYNNVASWDTRRQILSWQILSPIPPSKSSYLVHLPTK